VLADCARRRLSDDGSLSALRHGLSALDVPGHEHRGSEHGTAIA
jgi:hypothetical protein